MARRRQGTPVLGSAKPMPAPAPLCFPHGPTLIPTALPPAALWATAVPVPVPSPDRETEAPHTKPQPAGAQPERGPGPQVCPSLALMGSPLAPRTGSPVPSSLSLWTGSTRSGMTSSGTPGCCGPTTTPCPTSPWAAGRRVSAWAAPVAAVQVQMFSGDPGDRRDPRPALESFASALAAECRLADSAPRARALYLLLPGLGVPSPFS